MNQVQKIILQKSIKWHKCLSWIGGLALLIFSLSGLMHILMTWTGPKAISFFPPQSEMRADHVSAIPHILTKQNIQKVIMAKVVPSGNGLVLQVTEKEGSPRRYFDLKSGEEIQGYDEQHAVWLARYYTGLDKADIKFIHFQTQFDSAYPWVNRLLPVYRITFDTEDKLTAFVYTELGVLGGLTNNYKTTVQSIFRLLHTWTWLDKWEYARIFLMMIFLFAIIAMTAMGTCMIFLMKNRKMSLKRKRHRFTAYVIWLPLLMFSISGTYHLLHYAYTDNQRGIRLSEAFVVTENQFENTTDWLKPYQQIKLNAISLVEGMEGKLLYRLSLPQAKRGQKIERAQRFDGTPIEKPALYFDTLTGQESTTSDKDIAIYHAGKQLGYDEKYITNTTLVTRFGPEYDFRNKRLPVWRIDYDTTSGDKLFIDPATGLLVDRLTNNKRYESYSFSFLHKWNFLTPLIGRKPRDVLIASTLFLAIALTLFGYALLLRSKKGRHSS